MRIFYLFYSRPFEVIGEDVGKIVEIDVSVMVKIKYGRGYLLWIHWHFGRIQPPSDGSKRFFIELEEDGGNNKIP
ncbi:hypothetical protein HZS_5539 [Henneguya salminicola]|nr:hypothetical protein HZS_5539 [Henneguya salminicola]